MGAAVTLFQTHGTYQIGMSTSTSCFTNIRDFKIRDATAVRRDRK